MINLKKTLNIFCLILLVALLYQTYFYLTREPNLIATVFNTLDNSLSLDGHGLDEFKRQNPSVINAINTIEPSLASIESFNSGKLLQSGGGVVLTSDGLIMTLNSLVPLSADFYQISIDGKLTRGRVVYRDNVKNLAIIAVDEGGFLPGILNQQPERSDAALTVALSKNLTESKLLFNQEAKQSPGNISVDIYGRITGLGINDNTVVSSDNIQSVFLTYISKMEKQQ